jgi:hypothetical protein
MALSFEDASRTARFRIQDIDRISAEIWIVAKLEYVSDTA